MKAANGENIKTIKSKEEVELYLAKLKYALERAETSINVQEIRQIDSERNIEYSNRYTIARLFPDESPKEALRWELKKLETKDYIETVKDTRFSSRSDFWVFGRKYNSRDVYIKIRVEIVQRNYIFVMSFHFANWTFSEDDFPYAKSEEGNK